MNFKFNFSETGTDFDKAMEMGPPLNEIDFKNGHEIVPITQDEENEMKYAIQKGLEMGIDTMLNLMLNKLHPLPMEQKEHWCPLGL